MKKYIDPFLYGIPEIDLHGENRFSSIVLLKTFIENNVKLGNEKILIIHGKGYGILRKAVQAELKNNKYVISYKINGFNDGETIAELNLDIK